MAFFSRPLKPTRQARAGSLLATALVLLTVGLTFGLALGASVTLDLSYATQTENSRTAKRLAQSILQRAITEIILDPKFDRDLDMTLPDGKAALRFQPNNVERLAFSTNNWEGKNPHGDGRGVPQGMIHLLASSEFRGSHKRLEMLVDLPAFPLALACSGPVHLDGATVASVTDAQLESPLETLLASDLGPGHLASNSSKTPDSVSLERNSRVTGFVQSRGAIRNEGAEIGGELREHWNQDAELPVMESREFDPKRPDYRDEEVFYTELSAASYDDLELGQRTRRQGPLTVGGKLILNDCILFVDGDLTVNGGIEGQGAVAATGNLIVAGSSALRSQSRIALVADGDIQLRGSSKEHHKFQGILYSHGKIAVEKVTLLGSCIQNAPPGSPANQAGVTIREATVISAPLASAPSFDPPIEVLYPIGYNTSPVTITTKKVFAGTADEAEIIYGQSLNGGHLSGPGAFRELWNTAGPNDIYLFRLGYVDGLSPQYLVTMRGPNQSGSGPSVSADGAPVYGTAFYSSTENLLDGGLSGAGGGAVEGMRIFQNPNDRARNVHNQYNFPSLIAHGSPLHILTPEDGAREGGYADSPPGFSEAAFRANLRRTVLEIEEKRDEIKRRNSNRKHYFSLDPSRFLSRSRSVRIHFVREL